MKKVKDIIHNMRSKLICSNILNKIRDKEIIRHWINIGTDSNTWLRISSSKNEYAIIIKPNYNLIFNDFIEGNYNNYISTSEEVCNMLKSSDIEAVTLALTLIIENG